MGVRFVVDENIGRKLVDALRLIDYANIEHITETFKLGTSDEQVLEYVGKNGFVLISKDDWIRRHPNERALLLKYKIVAIFLGGKSMSMRETHKQIVNAWDNMEAKAEHRLKQGVAGAFKVNQKGSKIEEIPLNC
ncbi:hypothetical protein ANRL1_04837 [Anaerolineae bacterium]|nr:hypothetical protein ANRL1_04837 [Anaerolineae bacterium]